jgi:hypothetical protein
MVGGARSGGLEPAWMPVAAFYLSVFDLKYGKFAQTGPGPGLTEFSAVRAYIANPDIDSLRRTVALCRAHLTCSATIWQHESHPDCRAALTEHLAQRYDVELLAIYAYPAQVLFCATQFRSLRDVAGRRARTCSVGQSEMMAALGHPDPDPLRQDR